MTGAEHFREAERLLEAAKEDVRQADPKTPVTYKPAILRADIALKAASVHAQLALTSAILRPWRPVGT